MTKRERLDWQYRADYIRTRSSRRPGDTDIEPDWTDEAWNDPQAVWYEPDPASKSGETVRLVGYAPTPHMVLIVIALPEADRWIGVGQHLEGQPQLRATVLGAAMNRTPEELERLIEEETEASEASRDQPASPGGVRRRETRTEVYSVRLTPEEVSQIQRIAEEAGVPASGLVRGWVRQGLTAEREDSVISTVEALERDVDRLKRKLVDA